MAARYWRWDATEIVPGRREGKYFVLALLLYVAALLAKSAVVPLPAVILLLLWWKRPGWLKEEGWQLIPFFAAGLLMGLMTLWVEKHFVGTTDALDPLTGPDRLILIGKSLCFYLAKLAWPWPLIFVYPRWTLDASRPLMYLPLGVVLICFAALWRWRATRWQLVFIAAAYYVIMLSPACGTFNQYFFRYSFVADHLQYLASIGPLTLLAGGITALLRQPTWTSSHIVGALPVMLLVLFGGLTWRQGLGYRDAETLWRTTLSRNPECVLAQYDLGNILLKRGQLDDAIDLYRKAITLDPAMPQTHTNLGIALAQQGRLDQAEAQFQEALTIDSQVCSGSNPSRPDSGSISSRNCSGSKFIAQQGGSRGRERRCV